MTAWSKSERNDCLAAMAAQTQQDHSLGVAVWSTSVHYNDICVVYLSDFECL